MYVCPSVSSYAQQVDDNLSVSVNQFASNRTQAKNMIFCSMNIKQIKILY